MNIKPITDGIHRRCNKCGSDSTVRKAFKIKGSEEFDCLCAKCVKFLKED